VPRFEGFAPSSTRASATARAIRRRDTKPELALRRALFQLGLRYRVHPAGLPGQPDIVFRRQRIVVFVDGDFWHGRHWRARRAKLARGSNAAYWTAKIARNVARDREQEAALRIAGWRVLRFWEQDIRVRVAQMAAEVAALVRAEGVHGARAGKVEDPEPRRPRQARGEVKGPGARTAGRRRGRRCEVGS